MLAAELKKRDEIVSVRREKNGLSVTTGLGKLRLEPKRADLVRIRYTRREGYMDGTGIGICRDPEFAEWSYEEGQDEICLVTQRLTLRISRSDAAIRYYGKDGELLLGERAKDPRELDEFDSYRIVDSGQAVVEEVVTADGTKKVARDARMELAGKLYHTKLYLEFQEKEYLYGLGQAEEGVLNLRGTVQYLHQANRKIAVPFLLSTRGYGLLLATGSAAIFRDDAYGSYFYTEADPEMDYYFIAGGNFDRIIAGYRFLTGKAALLPWWAYGFIQSQERYETQEEILRIAEEYRRREIGLDGLVLDWCSWEEGMWGQKSFDKERFPDVKAMTDELHEKGIGFMISVWPNMAEGCDNYREFAEHKKLLPASDIYDAFCGDARRLYWKQLQEGIFRYGVDGWWCDSSEPFTPEWNLTQRPEPEKMYGDFVRTASAHMPAEWINAYGLVHARGIYEGQRGSGSSKRVVNLTRNGYTGQQRYGTILWSGDTEASWAVYRRQIVAGLNFCVSGLPYWTLDIGAFFVKRGMSWYWAGDYNAGMEDLGYQELFTRWYQLGAFLPIFRSHGTDVRREMWLVDGFGGRFYQALLAANRLRYRLMPCICSLAGAVWREDATMMRMLAFDFARDEKVCQIKDQFLFGRSLMVCPVTEPMYFGEGSRALETVAGTRAVYLPEGAQWYDFHTGERYQGGQTILADTPIERIPVYVRAGSILPTAAPGNHVRETLAGEIELLVYPGEDGQYDFYEDAGDGYGYEQGQYSITHMEWEEGKGRLHIGEPVSPAGFKGVRREYVIKIQGQ